MEQKPSYRIFVGSYAGEASQGIYVYNFNTEAVAFEKLDSISGVQDPSFLAYNQRNSFLYTTSEKMKQEGKLGSVIVSFAISDNGKLAQVNEQPTLGWQPCHLFLTNDNDFIFTSNYGSGSVAMFPIEQDGRLGRMSNIVHHEERGIGPVADRQEAPHTHSLILDKANRYAFVPDLGLDQIRIYKVNYDARRLELHGQVQLQPGAGPRHFAIHPSEKYAYSINELDSTITYFAYDPELGTLVEKQTVPALPHDYIGVSTCADIHITGSGKYLYGSNRGHDSIVIYSIDADTGLLSYVGHSSTMGTTPRNFAITPDDRYLLAANQDSDTIVPFLINRQTGELLLAGAPLTVSKPVCIVIV